MLLRAPSQLEEAAKRVAGKQPDDDGRVREGKSNQGPEARSRRFWPFITGFPFPLGPLLTRQTVRQEVGKAHTFPWLMCTTLYHLSCRHPVSFSTLCPHASCRQRITGLRG